MSNKKKNPDEQPPLEGKEAKDLEKKLTSGDEEQGGDMAFDPRMNAAPSTPAVAPKASALLPDNLPPNLADELVAKLTPLLGNRQNDMQAMMAMVGAVIKGLREPSDEEKAEKARRQRDRLAAIKEQSEMMQAIKDFQENCPHESDTDDGKTHSTISAIHNFPDGIPRGICSQCWKLIEQGDPYFKTHVVPRHRQAMRSNMRVG